MPSSYTTSLRLVLPVTGELTSNWGDTVNTGLTELVEDAIAGTATVAMADANVTLSTANEAADQARNMFISCTGANTAQRDIIVPAVSKLYFVGNDTTGGFGVQVRTSAGTGIVVPAGQRAVLYCDGTNVLNALTVLNGTAASAASVVNGGVSTLALADDAVTFAKLQNIATARILGRFTALTGAAEELTPAQVASLLAAINPAFAATQSSGQTVTSGNTVLCQFATEAFDTTAAYDTSTYRYTPQVAGYYHVSASVVGAGSTSTGRVFASIRKTGAAVLSATTAPLGNANTGVACVSGLVSMNGTTDYIDIVASVEGTGTITMNGGIGNGFSAFLVQRS